MTTDQGSGHILVVDDNVINRALLTRLLRQQGHTVATAEDGQQALTFLLGPPRPAIDVVLLDILMPTLDGYETLARIKGDEALRDLPVIMISAVDELGSVVRCVELGAIDYLPKPFEPALLRARVATSLASKRLRDLEREYLEQVGQVIAAAGALEGGTFVPGRMEGVAARSDALGQLARVFERMAREVRAREERLQRQVLELRIEIDEARQATKVAEITESDYFKQLRVQAAELRRILDS